MRTRTTPILAVVIALIATLLGATDAYAAGPLPRITITDTAVTNSATGAPFVSRGSNYIRLLDNGRGVNASYISTFEPGIYDRSRVIDAAQRMRHDGYNMVRTFVDEGRPLDWTTGIVHGMGRGLDDEEPVNVALLDNLADFVRIMADHGIYTTPVTYRLPQNCYYYKIIHDQTQCSIQPASPAFEGRNTFFLDAGFIKAKREYLKQFAAAMRTRLGAYSTSIYAYQSENEAYYDTSKKPWSQTSGTLTSNTTGYTYDMGNAGSRQQLADASFVKYTIAAKAGLIEGDPDGKLMIGVYTPKIVGKTGFDGFAVNCSTACSPTVDYRYPVRALIGTLYGELDIVDIHFYPWPASTGYTVAADLKSAEVDQYRTRWTVGEIGAHKAWWNNDIVSAAYGLRDAQVATCAFGTGAVGSLVWTFDTDLDGFPDQTGIYHLTTSGGAVNGVMAPIVRPNMCSTTSGRRR